MAKNIIKFIFGFFIVFLFLFYCNGFVLAEQKYTCVCNNDNSKIVTDCSTCSTYCLGFSSTKRNCLKKMTGDNSPDKFPNPFGDEKDPRVIIGQVIKAILGIVGSLALIMFIWGGLLWMTSGGNTDRLTKGRNTLVWAALGLVIIFASYALVHFVIEQLVTKT